jgi:peroxin-6
VHGLQARCSPTPHCQTATLGVPSNLATQYPYVLGPSTIARRSGKTHTLSVVQAIPLQEVFVQALSGSAYSSAKSNVAAFEDWLCHNQKILQQDSVLSMDSPDGSPLTYKFIMTEPVLQGYAQKSQTLFTLLPPTEDPPAINGHRNQSSSVPGDALIEFDDEDLEIGESFLAGSLAPQPTLYPQQNGSPTVSMPLFAHELTARPSSTPIYSELDDHTMYVRTIDLSKIGVLDGDWVSVFLIVSESSSSPDKCQAIVQHSSSRSRRIVRLEANDDVGES